MTHLTLPFPDTDYLQEILSDPLRLWLGETSRGASGPNLEYDPRFLELQQAAQGKPETQFSEAQPPVWSSVQQQAETLLSETHDIRILFYWLEAALHLEGIKSFAPAVIVLANWIETQWDTLHPELDPDDKDPFERLNALSLLAVSGTLLQAFRESTVIKSAHFGNVCVRHFEYAHEWTEPKQTESFLTKTQLAALAESAEVDQSVLGLQIQQAIQAVNHLRRVLQGKVDSVDLPDFTFVTDRLKLLAPYFLAHTPDASKSHAQESVSAVQPLKAAVVQSSGINSRQQAIDCIDQVCEYLEKHEPSNPAQLLLRRSKRMLNRDFVELVRELAPDALNDVARIFGIDPNEYTTNDY